MLKKVKDIWTREESKHTFLLYVISAVLLNLIMEGFARKNFWGGFIYLFQHPSVFFINTMIIVASLSITLMFRRRIFGIMIIGFFWVAISVVDFVLLLKRTTPFTAADLGMGDELLGVVGRYTTTFQRIILIVAIVLFVIALVLVWLKAPRVKYQIPRLYNLGVIATTIFAAAISISIGLETNLLSTKFANLTIAHADYGFPYCFGVSIFRTGVSKPKNYSKEKIEDIKDNIKESIPEDKTTNTDNKDNILKPNIIFLQLESFFDINKVKGLTMSQDPIPYFNELKAKYPSGFLNVHNVGYGTANTEFEIMTGMNLDDFGPGEFPYKTVLKTTTCESMAYNLKENGYSTHAMHNNTGTFYSRNQVFANLGYDTYTSLEYMRDYEKTPIGWVKDKVLIEEIQKVLDSTQGPDYLYAISVQGHGSYPTEPAYENPAVTVIDGVKNEGRKNAIEYYINEIREMDNFIRELVAKLSESEEDIILVMYGDHLPSLGFSGKDLMNGSEFQTEYIIWNNMNIKMEDEDIEAFQLSSKICKYLGITTGVINQYHQTQSQSEEYINGLQNLMFDIFGGNLSVYEGSNPYMPTDLQMGTFPITISNVESSTVEGEEEVIYITGTEFTPCSHVFVNGEKMNTEYIDETHLKITYKDVKPDDVFEVKQMWGEKNVVSTTDGYIYFGETTEGVVQESSENPESKKETKKQEKNSSKK